MEWNDFMKHKPEEPCNPFDDISLLLHPVSMEFTFGNTQIPNNNVSKNCATNITNDERPV
jgi:hypothetical protein